MVGGREEDVDVSALISCFLKKAEVDLVAESFDVDMYERLGMAFQLSAKDNYDISPLFQDVKSFEGT